jgi:hypothetical protein
MKTQTDSLPTMDIQIKINEILKLYKDASLSEMLNDLVAVGTWPTPERPLADKNMLVIKSGGSVAIDTVPLPERIKKLKAALKSLIKTAGDKKLTQLMETLK